MEGIGDEMKIVKCFVCLVLFSLILAASAVIAQEIDQPDDESQGADTAPFDLADLSRLVVDVKFDQGDYPTTWQPPPNDLIDVKDQSGDRQVFEEPQEPLGGRKNLAGLSETDLSQPSFIGPPDLQFQKEKGADSAETANDRVVYPEKDFIPIAVDQSVNEHSPAIAHGDGYYMITYIIGGDVWAQVFDQNGDHYNDVLVYDGWYRPCSNPVIAYESQTGLFIIVFEFHLDDDNHDIMVVAISPHEGKIGNVVSIAHTDHDEFNPDVACNAHEGSCLLAYQEGGSNQIQGKFLYIDSSGISGCSSSVPLSQFVGREPHLAWGRTTGNYFLAYSWFYADTSEWFPVYTHVYDVIESPPQYIHQNHLLVNYAYNPNFDKEPLGVTYDPCTNTYVLLWYDEHSAGDKDIHISVMKDEDPGILGSGCIACSYDNEYTGDISFVLDDHIQPNCGLADKVVVTYKTMNKGVYATDLRGNNDKTDPIFNWDDISVHALISADGINTSGRNPIITSGDHGKMFVTWRLYWTNTYSEDIWGKLIHAYWTDFLPLITR